MGIITVGKEKIMENSKIIIHMMNGDEYRLHNVKGLYGANDIIEKISSSRYDNIYFLEIDGIIAKEIIYVRNYCDYHKEPVLSEKERVLTRAIINAKNIVSIDYID